MVWKPSFNDEGCERRVLAECPPVGLFLSPNFCRLYVCSIGKALETDTVVQSTHQWFSIASLDCTAFLGGHYCFDICFDDRFSVICDISIPTSAALAVAVVNFPRANVSSMCLKPLVWAIDFHRRPYWQLNSNYQITSMKNWSESDFWRKGFWEVLFHFG